MAADRIKVWQCVGCGRIDDPQPCVGVCRDQKVEYVLAAEHDRVVSLLEEVVRTIAATAPREKEAARHWAALRERAKRALREIG